MTNNDAAIALIKQGIPFDNDEAACGCLTTLTADELALPYPGSREPIGAKFADENSAPEERPLDLTPISTAKREVDHGTE
jgi:hypothetical protein